MKKLEHDYLDEILRRFKDSKMMVDDLEDDDKQEDPGVEVDELVQDRFELCTTAYYAMGTWLTDNWIMPTNVPT